MARGRYRPGNGVFSITACVSYSVFILADGINKLSNYSDRGPRFYLPVFGVFVALYALSRLVYHIMKRSLGAERAESIDRKLLGIGAVLVIASMGLFYLKISPSSMFR